MADNNIPSLYSSSRTLGVTAHSHIKNLGIGLNGEIEVPSLCGLTGQEEARQALQIIGNMIKSRQFGGRAILLAGKSSTGKSALALALCRTLGDKIPFCSFSASEVYSMEVKKTEVITNYIRRATALRLKDTNYVYEGEVVSLNILDAGTTAGSTTKSIKGFVLTLRSAAGTLTIRLSPDFHREFVREKISPGDVIYIEANAGVVRRLGRCNSYAQSVDIELEDYVPLPKGPVYKSRDIVHTITLHDLDSSNRRNACKSDLASLIEDLSSARKTEITPRLRAEVDELVGKYVSEGKGELINGFVFIDECHLLDLECYAYLNRVVESPRSPVIVLATNRGYVNTIQKNGISTVLPFGVSTDFLDRLVIIITRKLSLEEILTIIDIKATNEDIEFTEDALQQLAATAFNSSIRYALQLMTPAKIIAEQRCCQKVTADHVTEARSLFTNPEKLKTST